MSNKCINSILGIIFVISSCSGNDEITPIKTDSSSSINKIMPLGASRVEGARPDFESFRYELWKLLVDGQWEFDYLGTQSDPASYPVYNGNVFDPEHEGRGGWTSGEILGGIDDWLAQTGAPDIVLFSSPGGNDALQGLPYGQVVQNINGIIDVLQSSNPNIIIILEQLAPAHSAEMTPELFDYFNQIQSDVHQIAADQSTADSQVLVVDMSTDFNDTLLADDVHYNEAGAEFIATRYYQVLVNLLK